MVSKQIASPRLRKLRRERDLSLDEVAVETGIERSVLSRKERGLLQISQAELNSLAAFFGVDPTVLQGDEPPQIHP